MSEQEQAIRELREKTARTAYYSSDVAEYEASLRASQQPPQVTYQYYNPSTNEYQATEPENPYLAEMDRFRAEARQAGAYRDQGGTDRYKGVKLGKYNLNNDSLDVVRKAVAYERAKKEGVPFDVALRGEVAKYKRQQARKEALQERTKAERRATPGFKEDPENVGDQKLKERLQARGRFASRVVPKYDGPQTGKASGIYESPLTGKPVIVREGSGATLPGVAKPKFYYNPYRPVPNLYTRDYTIYARVKGEGGGEAILTEASAPSGTTPPSPTTLYAPDTGEYGTNLSVVPPGTQSASYATYEGGRASFLEEKNLPPTLVYSQTALDRPDLSPAQRAYYATLGVSKGVFEVVAEPIIEVPSVFEVETTSRGEVVSKTTNPDLLLLVPQTVEATINFGGRVLTEPGKVWQEVKADPFGSVGRALPFALEGTRLTRGQVKASQAKGQVATQETIKGVPAEEIAVRPLESVEYASVAQETGGAGISYKKD